LREIGPKNEVGNRLSSDSNAWWASPQATSSVLLPDGFILTAFGAGYQSEPGPQGPAPRDVGLVQRRLTEVREPSAFIMTAMGLFDWRLYAWRHRHCHHCR
jgi:hypothetical protein